MDNSPINNLVDIQLGMNTGAHLYERLHEQIISSLWHSQETYLYKHVLSSCSFSQPVHDITTFRYKISIIFVAQICSSQSSKWNYSIRWNATPPQTPILIEIPSTGSRPKFWQHLEISTPKPWCESIWVHYWKLVLVVLGRLQYPGLIRYVLK